MNAKWLMLVLPFSPVLNAGPDTAATPAVGDFLYAIRQVESGDNYDCPRGRCGELGPYQFRPEVWHHYTQAAFSEASTALADDVAARHFFQIVQRLTAHGIPATTWNIAAVWNSGGRAVFSGRIPRTTRDYATRVTNLTHYAANLRRPPAPVLSTRLAVSG